MSRHAACRWLTLSVTATVFALAIGAFGASAASADTSIVGLGGWQVQSTAQATQAAAQISTPGFATGSWLHVRPDDAGAVGTEVNALVETGHCPNVFFSTNMKDCFGYMDQIGADTIAQFAVPWWFRTDFLADPGSSQYTDLIVNGVVGQADVWVNGHEIATQGTVQGDYTRYTFDITSLLRHGLNTLALEVYPNNPNTMFTLDNVDWTQIPPDNNTGIQFPILLHTSGPLALSNAHVIQDDAQDLSSAALTVKADVTNHAGTAQTGERRGGHPAAARMADPRQPHRDRCAGSDANVHVHAQRRSEPATSTTRACGGPTGWAASRSTDCTPSWRNGAPRRIPSQRSSASGRSRLAWSAPRPAMDSHRTGRASSASTAWRSCSGAAVGRRTCC